MVVPEAQYTHANNPGCAGGGVTTAPFQTARMVELYRSHEGYLDRFSGAVEAAVAAGMLVREDADGLLERARSRPTF